MKNKSPVVTVKERSAKKPAGSLAQHASERTPLLGDPTQDPNSGSAVVDREHADDGVDDSEDTEAGSDDAPCPGKTKPAGFAGLLALLLIGVFAANADTSLVLATYGTISSEFASLGSASWLLTAYMLAMCGSQPLYGKLSNLYGRKTLLLVAYVLFGAGCLLCGVARSMPAVIVGRLVSGCGGSGMTSVVSFLIADLVPKRQVASYRSYVNIVTTVGRSCGGPLGGWLAETVGWRWSFLAQVPVTALAIVLVGWRLQVPTVGFAAGGDAPGTPETPETPGSRLRRIDFLGATVMCAAIVTFLLPLSLGGSSLPWTHPLILALVAASQLLAALFWYVERHVAREPIFPLPLLARRDVVLPYAILFLQNMAQTLMMYGVPLYFQVTQAASPAAAGLYLVPAVVGNTVGGLLTGAYIQRAARYKLPTVVGTQVAALCHLLTSVRWTGNTAWPEALYIFPGGLGTGIIHASTFMAITASTSEEELAIAGGGLFLSGNFGSLLGVTLASSVIDAVTGAVAARRLPDRPDVVANALANIDYVQSLTGRLREAIVDAYVAGFRSNFGLACVACGVSLVLSLMIRERRL